MPAPDVPIADTAPTGDTITDYDRKHFQTYLRLLDAERAGAPVDEIARVVLGINPVAEPERARRVLESHLTRARWMSEHGYRQLAASPRKPVKP